MRRSLAQQECLGVQPCACATCQLIAGTGETLHYPHGSRPRAPSPSRRAYVYVLSARTPNKEARLHLARLLPDRAETIRTNQLRSCMRSAATQHTSLPTRYMRWALATGKRRTIRGRWQCDTTAPCELLSWRTHPGDVAVDQAAGRQQRYGSHVGHCIAAHWLGTEKYTCPFQGLVVPQFRLSAGATALRAFSMCRHGDAPVWNLVRCILWPCTRPLLQ